MKRPLTATTWPDRPSNDSLGLVYKKHQETCPCPSLTCLKYAFILGLSSLSAIGIGINTTSVVQAMVLKEPPKVISVFSVVDLGQVAKHPHSLSFLQNRNAKVSSAPTSIQYIQRQRLQKRIGKGKQTTAQYPTFTTTHTTPESLEWTRALFDDDSGNLDNVLQQGSLPNDDDDDNDMDIHLLSSSTESTSSRKRNHHSHSLDHLVSQYSTVLQHQQDAFNTETARHDIPSSSNNNESTNSKHTLKRDLESNYIKSSNKVITVSLTNSVEEHDQHGNGGNSIDKIPRSTTSPKDDDDNNNNHNPGVPSKQSQSKISRSKHSANDISRVNSKDISTLLTTKKTLLDVRTSLSSKESSNHLPFQEGNQDNDDNSHHQQSKDSSSIRLDFMDTNENKVEATPGTSIKPKRLSHEEEIQLGEIIQRGAHVHGIKAEFEKQQGRDITRLEWVQLAQLKSPKELRRLVSDYRLAKNTLVMSNMGLVHGIVRHRLGASLNQKSSSSGKNHAVPNPSTSSRSEYDELLQEGSLGLLRAAELYDPSRGLRFSTYATIWIKGVLSNANFGDTISLPLREKNKWNKIKKAREDLMTLNNQEGPNEVEPLVDQIAERCGLSKTDVVEVMTKMARAKNVLSLDYQYDSTTRSGSDTVKFDALANDKNLMDDVDLVERLQLRADIVATLVKNLDRRERCLMKLRYGLDDGKSRSIAECAEEMGISKARAQQLAAGCLKKLREADDAESLQEYLLSL